MVTQSIECEPFAPMLEELGKGSRLGRYEILMPLAVGGMAKVWIARQVGELGFRRVVVLKTIRPELSTDASIRRMFLEEAAVASRVVHANVLEVLDLGEVSGIVYQVMPLVEGGSLQELRDLARERGERLRPTIAVRIAVDFLRGLHAAHELTGEDGTRLELVHRDVSPQNVLLGIDGIARIADFGIAKALGRVEQTDGMFLKGKHAYMAPEQIHRRRLDRRTDVFASGIVLWEVLMGERLFRYGEVADTIERVLSMPIPSRFPPEVPPALAAVVLRALERDPEARFATCEAMADALEAAGAIASHRDVAAWVEGLARPKLQARRRALESSPGSVPTPSSFAGFGPVEGADPPLRLRAGVPEASTVFGLPPAIVEHRRALLAGAVVVAGMLVFALVVGVVALRRASASPPAEVTASSGPPVPASIVGREGTPNALAEGTPAATSNGPPSGARSGAPLVVSPESSAGGAAAAGSASVASGAVAPGGGALSSKPPARRSVKGTSPKGVPAPRPRFDNPYGAEGKKP